MNKHPLIEMKGIYKKFGAIEALKGVDFIINYNEIVGLIGDNGAGKSTLINILSGVYQPDKGKIYKEGKEVIISSHTDAIKLGIETIYQNTALVDQMSVMRNIFLGREMTLPFGFLNKRDMKQKALQILTESIAISGIKSPDQLVEYLSGGQKQAVAIARAVHFKSQILLLDEPTTALSVKESRKVLEYIKHLKENGVSSVFVTHNMEHVYGIADRLVILSRGEKIKDVRKEDTSLEELSEIMISH
ncbi:sugar ABC transporter ATP-binding protein [Candidatus Aerophobetes bacterium]|nr:sugar ABC transporter ATP-binding protein [Candidatus Aerophobetes bacterium]